MEGLWKGWVALEGMGAGARSHGQGLGGCSPFSSTGFLTKFQVTLLVFRSLLGFTVAKGSQSFSGLWAEAGGFQLSLGLCFTWHKGSPWRLRPWDSSKAAIVTAEDEDACEKSLWLGASAPASHASKAEGSLMHLLLFFFNVEGGGVLKSHPAPPCPPRSPTLARGTGDRALCAALQPRSAFCQPPFLCQSDGFCQVPDMLCPHAHKYLCGECSAHSDHGAAPSPGADARPRGADAR